VRASSHPPPAPPELDIAAPVVSVDDLSPAAYNGQTGLSPYRHAVHDGGKFFGGFGDTQIQHIDYWTLRARSSQLFNENMYARGLIRRLVTNEINIGLFPEALPEEGILGMELGTLDDWSENVENRFDVWGKTPEVCDWQHQRTWGALVRDARAEALICGDMLVVLRQSPRTKTPQVQLVSGNKVRSPLMADVKLRKGYTISHGVERDAAGRHVGYWVKQDNGEVKRIPARGERSGRRISWMVYGTDKRLDDVRGQPLLSLVLQSLKEIDRYRDSTQRKAVINSILAMFIKKTEDKMGSLPVTGGAVRRDVVSTTTTDGKARRFNLAEQIPGVVMEELQHGEEPVNMSGNGTDTNFGQFEEAIIQAVAWANEVPPEILRLAFSSNYSASQAAINEFKIYLNLVWSSWGASFCTPIYQAWLVSETLLQKIDAPGMLLAWRDPTQYDLYGAWVAVNWCGTVKMSTDPVKQGKGSKMYVDQGWSTNAREARGINGTKFSKNIKTLQRENEQKVDAMRPLAAFEKEFGADTVKRAGDTLASEVGEILSIVENSADG